MHTTHTQIGKSVVNTTREITSTECNCSVVYNYSSERPDWKKGVAKSNADHTVAFSVC